MAMTARVTTMDSEAMLSRRRRRKADAAPVHIQRYTRPGFMSIVSGVRKSTLAELAALLGLVSEEYTHRKENRPRKGDWVMFTDGDRQFSGVVIKVNRRSVNVLKQPNNIEMRVAFGDLLPQLKPDD